MSYLSADPVAHGETEIGRRLAQLREAQRLVGFLAGRPPTPGEGEIEQAARMSIRHALALPVTQRRFDALAAETATWAAAGLEALAAACERNAAPAAAAQLADRLGHAIDDLERLLDQPG